jgi:hypothetical protein
MGHMPLHMVKADLESRVLVDIRVEAVPRAVVMPMSVVFRKDATPPGLPAELSSRNSSGSKRLASTRAQPSRTATAVSGLCQIKMTIDRPPVTESKRRYRPKRTSRISA